MLTGGGGRVSVLDGPAPLACIVFCWGDGPGVRDAVLAETGDAEFAGWAAERYSHGGFGLYGAVEAYRQEVQTRALVAGGIELTWEDLRTLLGRAVKEAGELAASPEPVHNGAAPRMWAIAAKLKRVTESVPRGTVFRLAPDPLGRAVLAAGDDDLPHGQQSRRHGEQRLGVTAGPGEGADGQPPDAREVEQDGEPGQ